MTGSVDQTVKVWECRWALSCSLAPPNSKSSPSLPHPSPVPWLPAQPLTSRTPNYSWPWRFTFSPSPPLAPFSPSLLPYIGPALLRWLLSFYVNYSGCRVRLINVTQSLTHKHTQKDKKYSLHGESNKKKLYTVKFAEFAYCSHDFLSGQRVNILVCWRRWISVNWLTAPLVRGGFVLFYSMPPLLRSVTAWMVIEKVREKWE